MYWSTFLHFYQPPGQRREIIDGVVHQTYKPIVEGVLAAGQGRLTINLAGSLVEQLDQCGHHELIEKFAEAGRRGLIEFVGTSKYHAILPLLPPAEAKRQITINDDTLRHYLGEAYQRRGVYLPEMAYDPKLAPLLEELGFDWVLLDELAYNGRVETVKYDRLYEIKGTKLKAFFREHRLSDTLMSAVTRTVAGLKEAIGPEQHRERYFITGTDGETFGHHRVGHERLLLDMVKDRELNLVGVSELLKAFKTVETVTTQACTWASSQADLEEGIPYISWNDPANEIHALQWQLLKLAVTALEKLSPSDPAYPGLRNQLDKAVGSDQFYWAAARPWWMVQYIEEGAHKLLEVIKDSPATPPQEAAAAQKLYYQIMDTAWDWQRSGKIDAIGAERDSILRIPFKERTLELGGEGESAWHAFIHLMREHELEAAKHKDYEAAILWRDARYKLDQKLDIFDGFHVIDLLRTRLPHDHVEATLEQFRDEYNRIRGGQSEQRSH